MVIYAVAGYSCLEQDTHKDTKYKGSDSTLKIKPNNYQNSLLPSL